MGCCYRCAHRGVGEQQRQPQQLQAHAAQQAERLALAARREPLVEIAVQITVEIAEIVEIAVEIVVEIGRRVGGGAPA